MHQWSRLGATALATGILALSLAACEGSTSDTEGKADGPAAAEYTPGPIGPPSEEELAVRADTSKSIAKGARGYRVKCVQWGVNPHLRGGRRLVVDGDFGNATVKGVMEYQDKRGLKADGVVGPRTGGRMQADIVRLRDDARRRDHDKTAKHYSEWLKNCRRLIPG